MKKHITRSLCCLLALLLCLGSAIYTPAAQDDQTQVSFTVTLATGKTTDYATLKVQDKDGKTMPCQEDEYGYDTYDYLLPAGDYTYTATYQSGSQTASGSFTVVAGESRRIPVQLTYTQYKVRFNTTPQNATVALYKNGASGAYGDPILPDEQGYYTIIFGQYRYTVSAEGYATVNKTFNATDTALKNNNYVITVKLESPADKLLTQADNALFSVSGDGLAMIEYSGVHSDPDFGHYADIDSDYQDVNVQSAIEAYLAKKVKSDYPITVTVNKVENDEWDEDYTVIDKNGKIHYDAVTDDMLNFDETGAELTVSVTLTCLQSTKESEVTVLVPMHTYSRQERLDAAAKKAADLQTLLGDNTAADRVTEPVNLPTGDDDFSYYGIVTGWTSDHPEVIDPTTGAVTPAKADTIVTLTVKAFYTAAQLEEAGFLFDPGPLGDNQSLQTVTLTVPGTGEPESIPEIIPAVCAFTPFCAVTYKEYAIAVHKKPIVTTPAKSTGRQSAFTNPSAGSSATAAVPCSYRQIVRPLYLLAKYRFDNVITAYVKLAIIPQMIPTVTLFSTENSGIVINTPSRRISAFKIFLPRIFS